MKVLMEKLRIDGSKIVFSKKFIYYGIFCLLMLCPDDVFALISLYSNQTDSSVPYKWLYYSFGIVQLAIIVMGIFMFIAYKKKWVLLCATLLLFREVLFFISSDRNIFSTNSYEMYLCLMVGVVLIFMLRKICGSEEESERLFLLIIYLNIASVYLSLFMNLNGIVGRYNASNLDVGSTGVICVVGIIDTFFTVQDIKKKIIKFLLLGIALFLSGSRVNLLLLLVILIFIMCGSFVKMMRNEFRVNRKVPLIASVVIGVGVFGLVALLSSEEAMRRIDDVFESIRIMSMLSVDTLLEDSSFIGRFESIGVGFDIIKDNPLGMSYYFNNIQVQSHIRGFSTFPHSGILVLFDFFGPIMLVALVYLFRVLKGLKSKNRKWFYILLYIMLFNTISGAPIVNFKLIFIYGTILYLAHYFSKKKNV